MAKLAGKDLELYIDGVKIGDAKDCTLNISQALYDATSKDDGNWIERGVAGREWSVDASVIFDESNSHDVVDTVDLIINQSLVSVRFNAAGMLWIGQAYATSNNVSAPMSEVTGASTTFTGDESLQAMTGWHLPSIDELVAMRDNLHNESVGDFVAFRYLSSSENSSTLVQGLNFATGSATAEELVKTALRYARPTRTVIAAEGTYSLRDTGPNGGLIYYVSGTSFYEAAPSDVENIWSNISDVSVGTTGTAIGTGLANSMLIINQEGCVTSLAKDCMTYSL